MIGRAGHTRLGTRPSIGGGRWTFWLGHVCARCHRNKKHLHAILRSGSELVSPSERMLLLAACRPGARVLRACAVGIARRGAQLEIGRLGAPCKAGWALLLTPTCLYMSPHAPVPSYRRSCRPRSPASRNGTGQLSFAPRRQKAPKDIHERTWAVCAGWAGLMGRTRDVQCANTLPGRLGGAGRAHVEGGWLGRIFWA
jgi:hypothetical protein